MIFSLLFAAVVFRMAVASTVRQCSCAEQSSCLAAMKRDGEFCANQCFGNFRTITSRPEQLKACFTSKRGLFDGVVTCLEASFAGRSCVQGSNGPQIQRQSMSRVISSTVNQVSRSVGPTPTRGPLGKVITAATNFGECVRGCFVQRHEGICYEQFKCQPQLPSTKDAKQAVSACSKSLGLGAHAGETCNCAVNAGVSEVKPFCPMLQQLASRAG